MKRLDESFRMLNKKEIQNDESSEKEEVIHWLSLNENECYSCVFSEIGISLSDSNEDVYWNNTNIY